MTVNRIEFDDSNSYFIAGTGSVNLEADTGGGLPSIDVLRGDHEFQAPVNVLDHVNFDVGSGSTLSFNNSLNLGGNTLTKTGSGEIAIRNDLVTSGGTVNVIGGTFSVETVDGPPADVPLTPADISPGTVAWFAVNPNDAPGKNYLAGGPISPTPLHADGPFAVDSDNNPDKLPVKHPINDVFFAFNPMFDICKVPHLHGSFNGHGDPDGSSCGHGIYVPQEAARPDFYDVAKRSLNEITVNIGNGAEFNLPGVVENLGDGVRTGPGPFDTFMNMSGPNANFTAGSTGVPQGQFIQVIDSDGKLTINDDANLDLNDQTLDVRGKVGAHSGSGTLTLGSGVLRLGGGTIVGAGFGELFVDHDNLTPSNNNVDADLGSRVLALDQGSVTRPSEFPAGRLDPSLVRGRLQQRHGRCERCRGRGHGDRAAGTEPPPRGAVSRQWSVADNDLDLRDQRGFRFLRFGNGRSRIHRR